MLGLVDGNNFFVSCERVFSPELEGRPVAVLSNNDGCVVSRSNEFKALGIKMGTPYFKLKPDIERLGIVLRSSNYALYGDMSRRIIEILGLLAPDVEQYSIDEAYIYPPEVKDYFAYGRHVRETILKWTGIPCGVGFAKTKTLCKIANHIGKKLPLGVFVMPQNCSDILRETPVGEVWGIGRALAPQLEKAGVLSAYDLASCSLEWLRNFKGVMLERTALELRGVSCLDKEEMETSKSISFSRSFGKKITALQDMHEAMMTYLGGACRKLRGENQSAAGCLVYLQRQLDWNSPDFSAAREIVFKRPTDSPSAMMKEIGPHLKKLFDPRHAYKKCGVVLFGLESQKALRQTDLFAPLSERAEKSPVFALVDKINAKYGKDAIKPLSEGIKQPWRMQRGLLSKGYTTCWDELLTVK